MTAILRTDGGARPTNPGHAGFACVLDVDGEIHSISRYVGMASNNEAEYFGVIVGLKWAKSLGIEEILVISDSQLVVNQVLRKWQVKNHYLKGLARDVQDLLSRFQNWDIQWEKRTQNKVADDLCTKAINWGRNQNPWTPQSIKLKRPGEIHDPFDASTRLSQSRAADRVRLRRLATSFTASK